MIVWAFISNIVNRLIFGRFQHLSTVCFVLIKNIMTKSKSYCLYLYDDDKIFITYGVKGVSFFESIKMLHWFIIPHVQTQSNQVCYFHVIFLWFMLPRDHFVSRFFYFTTAGVKCCLAAVKVAPYFTSVLL
jgi:hypothetical protein